MAVGFVAVNDDGIYQIDETTLCSSLQKSGQVLLNIEHRYSAGNRVTSADVSYTGIAGSIPFLAVRADRELVCGIEKTTKSGNNYTFRLTAGGRPGASRLIDYFIFDIPRAKANGAGWELYHDDGRLQFATHTPPMVVMGPLGAEFSTREYALCGSVWWTSDERVETEDGVQYFYSWAYYLNGPVRRDSGGSFGNIVASAGSGQGNVGLPGGIPNGYAANNFGAILNVDGYPTNLG